MFMKSKKVTLTERVHIPARENAPDTYLHLKILQNEVAPLGSRPVMFLLPGGPGLDHSTYQSYACLLDIVDIVFHDPRGCGQSDKNDPSSYSMENYIEDVEIIRRFLNLEKIILLGKSYGSVCAMGYALRYQHFIEKLVLSAGAPSYRSIETAKAHLEKTASAKQLKLYKKLWDGEFKSHAELAEFYFATAPLYSHHIKTKLESYMLGYFAKNFCYEAANLGFSDFLRKFDFEPNLHEIKCNTLILAGEEDWINDIRHIKIMAEKIPNNVFKSFPNAGHTMESDAGKVYFDTIRDFITEKNAF
ncbi:MAG: alpha/beta hydrolase [Coxiellaceae bacterium]|nr:alpha/beta hydrolase [Coxiellaceae bacterium]